MAVRKVGDDAEAVKRVTCRNCGSILEYLPRDVQSKTSRDYSGVADTDYWVDCPECGKRVTVKGAYS